MTNLNNSTGNFSKVKTFDILMQSMKKTVTEVETSANAMSEMFDSVKTGISHDLQQVKGTNEQLDSKLSSSISGSRRIKNPKTQSLTDLRSRSMRDDLIFTGIPEKTQRYEECVENLRDLLRRKLHFFGDISFERVHKLENF